MDAILLWLGTTLLETFVGFAFTALLVYVVAKLWRLRPGGRSEFTLTRDQNGDWWLERVAWRLAMEVRIGHGIQVHSDEWTIRQYATLEFGDMRRREAHSVGTDEQQIFVSWITWGRRRHSPTYKLDPDASPIQVQISAYRGRGVSTQR